MKSLKGIITDTMFIGFVQVCNVILTIISTGIILKFLGAQQYGLLSIYRLFTVKGFLSFFDFGFKKPLAREFAYANGKKDYEKFNRLISVMFFLSISIALLIVAGLFFIVPKFVVWTNIPNTYREKFIFFIRVTFFLSIIDIPGFFIMSLFEGLNRYKILKTLELFQAMFFSIIAIIFSLKRCNVDSLIVVFMLTTTLFSLIRLFVMFDFLKYINFSLGDIWYEFKILLNQARFYFLANLSSTIGNYAPNLIISILFNPTLVAYADVIQKMPRVIKNSMGFIGQNLMVVTSERAANNDKFFVSRLFNNGLKLYQFILIPITIVFAVFIKPILSAWLGQSYSSVLYKYSIFAVLSIALFPVASFGWNFLSGYAIKLEKLALFQWTVTGTKVFILLIFSKLLGLWTIVITLWVFIVVLPLNMRYYVKYLDMDIKSYLLDLARILSVCLMLSYVFYNIDSINWLISFSLALIFSYLTAFFLYLRDNERMYFLRLFRIKKYGFILRKGEGYVKEKTI